MVLGLSNLRPVLPKTAPQSGHAVAVHIGSWSRVFDPNYGIAAFSNSDDLCKFLIELLSSYRDLSNASEIWRYS
ncbi:YopT-type cysteine protease domain-containing protein [Trinickia fusca]|uniref:Peptidase C58 YopT-type domain-containing protein n=1 Tax=Trinickia fusca TaxID=2419777 RepID=A0A494XFT0_9BURK|nr:hypothetical protein D7S89_11540 [Trinickia fusca]